MAVGFADFVLVPCSVNIDKTIAGIDVVRFDPIEPENARQYQVLSRWKGVVGSERDASDENCPCRHGFPNLVADPKFSERRFVAVFFRTNPESRRGNWITADNLSAAA